MKLSCLYLLAAGGLLPGSLAAQHLPAAQLPEAVRESFARAQPQAHEVSWQQRGTTYEVTFQQPEQRGLRGLLQLAPTGEVLESRLDVPYATLPPLARTAIGQQFPHRRVDRLTRVVRATGTTYVALVCKGKDKNGKDKDCQTSVFDENGRPLAK